MKALGSSSERRLQPKEPYYLKIEGVTGPKGGLYLMDVPFLIQYCRMEDDKAFPFLVIGVLCPKRGSTQLNLPFLVGVLTRFYSKRMCL